ncbi:MAG: hypothetical protein KIS62_12270 [Ramlibacter sp.]|nr:hypothetical protein [Ramlibacter sp.]MCW5650513.1 hypothetical protein [Ramlibacter sp.]
MTEVVWVALISAGTALVTALLTQLLATRAASKQADRAERREALQWQRSEALRLQELQRSEAHRQRELHEARLREFWAHVLRTQDRIRDALDYRVENMNSPAPGAEDSAASACALAYAVALIGLPGVRELAKSFYLATARAEMAIVYEQDVKGDSVRAWRDCFDELESAVARESAVLVA